MAWVGHTTIDDAVMSTFLQACQTDDSQYFLRWPHRVSGFVASLPKEEISPEGQLFDGDRELRWRRVEQGYSVLLLSNIDTPDPKEIFDYQKHSFQAIGNFWDTQTWNAQVYPDTETRLPTSISTNGVDIKQRHFVDRTTATVYFTALVVVPSSSKKKEDS